MPIQFTPRTAENRKPKLETAQAEIGAKDLEEFEESQSEGTEGKDE